MNKKILVGLLALAAFYLGTVYGRILFAPKHLEVLSPVVPVNQCPYTPPIKKVWKGTASYYSVDGCIGCRSDLLMANGEKFDENAIVTVKNTVNSEQVTVTVTDTGGFNKLGRIADLSLGVKNRLNCSDLCQVEIEEVL